MISIVKARKMLSNRGITYLTYIINRSDKVILGLKDASVV